MQLQLIQLSDFKLIKDFENYGINTKADIYNFKTKKILFKRYKYCKLKNNEGKIFYFSKKSLLERTYGSSFNLYDEIVEYDGKKPLFKNCEEFKNHIRDFNNFRRNY